MPSPSPACSRPARPCREQPHSHLIIPSTRGITMLTRIDHVMICVPDLQQGIDTYTRLGFTVSPGGVHTGQGTHNAIAFHEEDYLELLSVRDRDEDRAGRPGGGLLES